MDEHPTLEAYEEENRQVETLTNRETGTLYVNRDDFVHWLVGLEFEITNQGVAESTRRAVAYVREALELFGDD